MNDAQISAFHAAVIEACHFNGEVNYRSYSGRAMYGKDCFAIAGSFSDCRKVIQQVAVALLHDAANRGGDGIDDNVEDLMRTLVSYDQDQMGLGAVFYWAEIAGPEEEG